jgi:hypothetical protein
VNGHLALTQGLSAGRCQLAAYVDHGLANVYQLGGLRDGQLQTPALFLSYYPRQAVAELRSGGPPQISKRYLVERDLPVSEIAWLLGYDEISSFTHAFKR